MDEVLLDLGPRYHAMAGAEPALPQNIRSGDRSAALLAPYQGYWVAVGAHEWTHSLLTSAKVFKYCAGSAR